MLEALLRALAPPMPFPEKPPLQKDIVLPNQNGRYDPRLYGGKEGDRPLRGMPSIPSPRTFEDPDIPMKVSGMPMGPGGGVSNVRFEELLKKLGGRQLSAGESLAVGSQQGPQSGWVGDAMIEALARVLGGK